MRFLIPSLRPSGRAPGLAYPLRARSSRTTVERSGRKSNRGWGGVSLHSAFVQGVRHMTNALPIVHIVDDDVSFRTAIGDLLSACGYTVALYESATQLLNTLPADEPACILLDVQMAGLSGPHFRVHLVDWGKRWPMFSV